MYLQPRALRVGTVRARQKIPVLDFLISRVGTTRGTDHVADWHAKNLGVGKSAVCAELGTLGTAGCLTVPCGGPLTGVSMDAPDEGEGPAGPQSCQGIPQGGAGSARGETGHAQQGVSSAHGDAKHGHWGADPALRDAMPFEAPRAPGGPGPAHQETKLSVGGVTHADWYTSPARAELAEAGHACGKAGGSGGSGAGAGDAGEHAESARGQWEEFTWAWERGWWGCEESVGVFAAFPKPPAAARPRGDDAELRVRGGTDGARCKCRSDGEGGLCVRREGEGEGAVAGGVRMCVADFGQTIVGGADGGCLGYPQRSKSSVKRSKSSVSGGETAGRCCCSMQGDEGLCRWKDGRAMRGAAVPMDVAEVVAEVVAEGEDGGPWHGSVRGEEWVRRCGDAVGVRMEGVDPGEPLGGGQMEGVDPDEPLGGARGVAPAESLPHQNKLPPMSGDENRPGAVSVDGGERAVGDVDMIFLAGVGCGEGSSTLVETPGSKKRVKQRRRRSKAQKTAQGQSAVSGSPVQTAAEGQSAVSVSPVLCKYWLQRYSLWSRYDEGIMTDEEGWYSVTPEVIAVHQAERCGEETRIVLDAFTGTGANAIQCGMRHRVIAVDINSTRLHMAASNAAIYGVQKRVDFVCADYFSVASKLRADIVFMSPPWGGPQYVSMAETFNIDDIGGMNKSLKQLIEAASASLRNPSHGTVIVFLPRNTPLQQLREHLPNGYVCEVERAVLNLRLKAITLYICKS
eukprot:jgi/Botrbrau1/18778/Bobra.0386s0095.1